MEADQLVVAPSPWRQRIMAGVGMFFWAYSLVSQVILLAYLAPKFRVLSTNMNLTHAGALGFLATWRWPLLLALLAAEGVAIVVEVRGPRYGWRLFIAGLAAFAATAVLACFVLLSMIVPFFSTMQ